MKLLAIGAHPDDIEIFMYGLLAICKNRGDDVYAAIATDGSKGGTPPGKRLAEIRALETKNALKGMCEPYFFNFIDGELSFSKNAEIEIKNYIEKINPDLIVTHAPNDYHSDHRCVSYLIKNISGFNTPIIFADTLMGIDFIPDYFFDITKYFEAKKSAILKHISQTPHKFLDAAFIMNSYRAAQCNAPKGCFYEGYKLYRNFPFNDVRSLLPEGPKMRPFNKGFKNSLI